MRTLRREPPRDRCSYSPNTDHSSPRKAKRSGGESHLTCMLNGANGRTRTGDLRITSALLYQLSHVGMHRFKREAPKKYSQEPAPLQGRNGRGAMDADVPGSRLCNDRGVEMRSPSPREKNSPDFGKLARMYAVEALYGTPQRTIYATCWSYSLRKSTF